MLAIDRRRRADPLPRRRRVAGRPRRRRRSAGATTATSAAPAAACASWPSTAAAPASSIPTTAGWSTPPSGRGCASTSSTSTSPFDHLVLASTLPWLMLPGVHHLEGWDEAISEGAWSRPGKWIGERVRQVARPRALGGVPRVVRRDGRAARRRRRARQPPPATVLLRRRRRALQLHRRRRADRRRPPRHGDPPAHDVAVPQRHPSGSASWPTGCSTARRSAAIVHRMARWARVADVGHDLAASSTARGSTTA